MKRNKYGINLDEGIALSSEEEFEILFIESDCDCETRLVDWIQMGEQPLLFGGQIGCGKTTSIEQAFRLSGKRPDIVFHFDRNDLNLSPLDAWIIVFSEIARFSASEYFPLLAISLPELNEIFGLTPVEVVRSVSLVLLEEFSPAALEKHRKLKSILEPILEHLPKMFQTVVVAIEEKLEYQLMFLAAGVDKFEPSSAAYIGLSDILTALAHFKTLFEVNAVHLFTNDRWTNGLKKHFLTASRQKWIEEMLNKRLGVYAKSYQLEIPILAEFSGGIPRQALRLLDHFKSQNKLNIKQHDKLIHSLESVNRDFFSFSKRPDSKLLNVVLKQGMLETSLISVPGDIETALLAVYGNWIILRQHKSESQWEAYVNPLIKSSILNIIPNDPVFALFKKYAIQQDIGENGLDIDTEISGWKETLIQAIEKPIELNITEILDAISSALLSRQRDDRIIVAYESKKIVDIVLSYLKAKSNSYEYQVWQHSFIEGGDYQSPLTKLLEILNEKSIDIYSIELIGNFTIQQLTELNIRRDTFIGKQLIWWIPKNNLAKYLIHWTQLRQLFKVFILDDDISKALNAEDIEADLNFMEDLVEYENTAEFDYVSNLKKVLVYLKESRHG